MEGEALRDREIMEPEGLALGEEPMVQEDRWKEIHRLHDQDHLPIAEIARRVDLDRKTVRRCLSRKDWQPYRRTPRTDTLLAAHAEYLQERTPQVHYSAQILFQELRRRGYTGSYETVKRFVQPLRAAETLAERACVRFETPPGQQSQIDWGQARVHFRLQPAVVHLFILTLGFSRRGFYHATLNERLPQFLEAHELAFEHFGGHTREHLYDRPRTVCAPSGEGGVIWNPTFRSFADYWGFEPRLCRPYRARTKGKVESGVKYVKRNFLPGRDFTDFEDLSEQLAQWNHEIADVRVHGTTHERPIDRFAAERPHLVSVAGQPGFRLEARFTRIVAEDFLVSFETNRYSVPFTFIGQSVEVQRRAGEIRIFHGGRPIASHLELGGKYQLRVLPEHGPGAVARNQRLRGSTPAPSAKAGQSWAPQVEVRDLSTYEALCRGGEA
jgi:transposase